jgi:transitional endoplasmic reticulum ATPase
MDHFEHALDEVKASVDEEMKKQYDEMEERFGKEEPDRQEVSRTFQ